MQVDTAAFHENNAGKMIRWHSALLQDALSGCRLQGSESQVFAWVASDEEPHGTIAQVADAIEEEYVIICRFVGFGHCLIG